MIITIINPCFLKQTKNKYFIRSRTNNMEELNNSRSTCIKHYYFSDYESWSQISIHSTSRSNLSHCVCKSDIRTFHRFLNDNIYY